MDRRTPVVFRLVVFHVLFWLLYPPPPVLAADQRVKFSDAGVKDAIKRGVEFLWSKQRPDGSWPPYGGKQYVTGPTAMAIYALLESGVNPQEPRMAKALKWLEKTPEQKTYCLAMRCCVWESADRYRLPKHRKILQADVLRIMRSTGDGSFSYDTDGSPKRGGDNSTSQFGLLAMWVARLADVNVPDRMWRLCMKHWMRTQSPEGGWNYRGGGKGNKPTMTAAGVASMYVCVDNLMARTFVTRRATADAFAELMTIQKGVDRLDSTFSGWDGKFGNYHMYGIERVGLACGYKYFNGIDWYKHGAVHLLKTQRADGSWGEVYATAFSMLFLIRGQHPVLFNKLRYDGDWNNRPRDLAALTRWMSKTLERTLNWQIVDLKMPVSDWLDAPMLVITGSKATAFTDADIAKLREFTLKGGTIISATEFRGKAFSKAIRDAYGRMFPDRKLKPLPRDHELYTARIQYRLKGALKFEIVSNGIRPLVIHTDQDMPARWQSGAITTASRPYFDASINIARYVAGTLGRLGKLRNRGVSPWPEEKKVNTTRTIRIARVRHGGNWNPEPLADTALAMKMKNRVGIKLAVGPSIAIAQLPQSGVKFAMMTGTEAIILSEVETAAFKSFVQDGGTVLIDAAGGNGRFGGKKPFARSIRDALKEIFPGRRNKLRQLANSAPLYTLAGYEIKTVRFRRHTHLSMKAKHPQVRMIRVGVRPAVLFSELDLTASFVGYPSLVVNGYTPDSAFKIVRNMILYANRQPSTPPSSALIARADED
ncbi:MAG: DUF4159 domain-containing protein [Phycisphaerae bacterium]|jgi:hypothetical protein|nr:DUF4159 domain-containing protein [Phycisphaerae bacterium]